MKVIVKSKGFSQENDYTYLILLLALILNNIEWLLIQ